MNNQKLLTPLELKVMNILWRLQEAFVKEILEKWPEKPAPAYNTVSTTVRILQDKKYVKHRAFGRTHQYFPVISKTDYQKILLNNVVKNAFSGSITSLVSALVDNEQISDNELDEIQGLIDNAKAD